MRDREPGLAGTGRADTEDKLMTLERADIGVLARGARPHRALAHIDLFEGRTIGGFEIEQRALRDRKTDRAVDVALGEIVATLDLLVKTVEHAARALAGVARTLKRDLIAARVGHDVELAFDQRKVLPVLAE